MRDSDLLPRYFISTALQAMEQAHAQNSDMRVASHISRAIAALHELMHQASTPRGMGNLPYDPHEMDEFNSAV